MSGLVRNNALSTLLQKEKRKQRKNVEGRNQKAREGRRRHTGSWKTSGAACLFVCLFE